MPATHRADQEFAEVGDLGRVPLASYGARLAARLIDLLIVLVPACFPIALFGPAGFWGAALVWLLLLTSYDAVLTVNTGATPGKRITRVKVVRLSTGEVPGWGRSLLRAIVLAIPTWVVAGIWALSDERLHRGPHDRAAGTVVIAA